MAELFKKVKGYFLKYSSIPVNDTVRRWNIKILNLD
jgi:hypothetical protein